MNLKKIAALCAAVMLVLSFSVSAFAANDVSGLDAWKAEKLEQKEARLNDAVAAGTVTKEQADSILDAMRERMASCDGTDCENNGQCSGEGCGLGNGEGCGLGNRVGGGRAQRGGGRGANCAGISCPIA